MRSSTGRATVGDVRSLHGAAGNRAVATLLAGAQAKLEVAPAGDRYEREADRIAEGIVAGLEAGRAAGSDADNAGPAHVARTVQRRPAVIDEKGGALDPDTEEMLGAARRRGRPLDVTVRRDMERAFGAEFGSVRVHDGSAATELSHRMHAKAFTIGSDIFFRGRTPGGASRDDRHLLAHELTHTLQQAGQARRVIRRYFDLAQAAHAKLGVSASTSTSFPGHQRDAMNKDFLKGTAGAGAVHRVGLGAIPDIAVSDDGEMAIEASAIEGDREVEAFFASKKVVDAGKKKLSGVKSEFTLSSDSSQHLTVPDLKSNKTHKLMKVVGAKAGGYLLSRRPKGATLEGLEQCIEMAEAIIGSKTPRFLLDVTGGDPSFNTRDLAQQMLLYIGAYIDAFRLGGAHEGNHAESQKVAQAALNSPPPMPAPEEWEAPVVEVTAVSKEAFEKFKTALGRHTAKNQYRAVFTTNMEEPRVADGKVKLNIQVVDEAWADRWQEVLDDGDVGAHIEGYSLLRKETTRKPLDVVKASAMLEDRKRDLIDKINKTPDVFAEINKRLGMNERAAPEVGEAYEIFHKGDGSKKEFPYHFAGVVSKSGVDTVTFENYARERKSSTGADQRMYFQMYGPKRDVTVSDTGITHDAPRPGESTEEQEERELAAGSFHGKWKGMFVDAQTVAVGKNRRTRGK